MTFAEAAAVFAEILGRIGLLIAVGLVGLAAVAWAWYKYDGGELGFFDWMGGF